jgi:uncharacterized protein YbcC (UPF0753/DUF2309 family)
MHKEKNESVARFINNTKLPKDVRSKMKQLKNKLDKINMLYATARIKIISAQSKLMRSCNT